MLFSPANILLIADVIRRVLFLPFLVCFYPIVPSFLPRETSEIFRHYYQILIPKQRNLVPRSSRLTVQFSSNYAAQLTSFFTCRKNLPNLVKSSWL